MRRGGEGGLVRVVFMRNGGKREFGIMFWVITEKGEEFCV